MRHIRAKQYENPPSFVTVKISPIDPIPEDSFICDYGVDTLYEGSSSDLHYHDCDEWWIIINGRALVSDSVEQFETGPGDMVFTPMGETHRIEALTLLPLPGLKALLGDKNEKGIFIMMQER